uniref:Si:dkeyp-30e7.2 n=1 Tax=Iconisemion striatum TaxID=60296 RepID=A0A1A7X744_9TELE
MAENEKQPASTTVILGQTTRTPKRKTPFQLAENKKRLDAERGQTRVSIGIAFQRWRKLRDSKGLKTDTMVAIFLLDSYERASTVSSTVVHQMLSESDRKSSVDTPQRDVNVDDFNDLKNSLIDWDDDKRHSRLETESMSSEEDGETMEVDAEYTDSEDENFLPPICVRTGGNLKANLDLDQIPTISLEDTVHDAFDNSEESPCTEIPSVHESLKVDVEDDLIGRSASITYQNCLKQLVDYLILPVNHCPAKNPNTREECMAPKPFEIQIKSKGTASAVEWLCPNGHTVWKWTSQPTLQHGSLAGDFMLACNILLSGNNFSKIALLFKFMNMGMVSAHNFVKIQDAYCVDAIKDFWEKKRGDIIQQLQSKGPVVILGDSRMDSPGFSVQYCTYSAIENDSKKVVNLVNIDQRETQINSLVMEKMGFIKTLDRLTKELQVLEICTDVRPQISALFNEGKYKDCGVIHTLDMWHGAKSLGKKIHMAGQQKGCSLLLHWTKHICNHFWHCCKTADNFNSFLDLWISILHHVVGEHSECHHGPLVETSAKVWLQKNSLAYQKLREIVLDSRWLKTVHKYLHFRSTADLESFHNHILMYAGKRYSFSPPVHSARTMLAAIDYNHHVDRPAKRKADGSIQYAVFLSISLYFTYNIL